MASGAHKPIAQLMPAPAKRMLTRSGLVVNGVQSMRVPYKACDSSQRVDRFSRDGIVVGFEGDLELPSHGRTIEK